MVFKKINFLGLSHLYFLFVNVIILPFYYDFDILFNIPHIFKFLLAFQIYISNIIMI